MLRGDEIWKNNAMRTPAVFILAGMIVLCAAGSVQAEPTMDIQSSYVEADFDDWKDPGEQHPGDELRLMYSVENTSQPGTQNNMINFTLPAGSNLGVYEVLAPSGWSFAINADNTFFSGNGNVIEPQSILSGFHLYSTDLNIHQDYATATAEGIGATVPFQPELTDVPGEYPRTLEADIYFDGIVNLLDFAVLAGEWMDEEDWYSPPYAGGGPEMTIQYATDNTGWFEYLIRNTSQEPDIGAKNMIDFVFPAGANQGVYDAYAQNDWNYTIFDDYTIFNHGTLDGLLPGEQTVFELYSTDLNIHHDYATATATGPPLGLLFEPVKLDVPGEYPRTLEADIYFDGIVDANDLKQMTDEWLMTESWYVP